MSQPAQESESTAGGDFGGGRGIVARIGVDWWATIVAGVITALAVANLLPKIPW